MKTAEEWAKDVMPDMTVFEIEDMVKQIQYDAIIGELEKIVNGNFPEEDPYDYVNRRLKELMEK